MSIIHSSSTSENTFDYHLNLLTSIDYAVYDRFNLGEIVYPAIYSRESKMNLHQHRILFSLMEELNIPYIIFYSSDFEVLKKRLFSRGDTEEVLANAEKINSCFKLLAEQLSSEYSNIHTIDISKVENQIDWFNKNIKNYKEK